MRYTVFGLAVVVSCGLLMADGALAAKKKPPARKKPRVTRQSKLRRAKSYMGLKDKNKDGKLTRRELGLKPEVFAKADRNNDGFVSQGELVTLPGFGTNAMGGMDGKSGFARKRPGAIPKVFPKVEVGAQEGMLTGKRQVSPGVNMIKFDGAGNPMAGYDQAKDMPQSNADMQPGFFSK